jgi:hypothetical protein
MTRAAGGLEVYRRYPLVNIALYHGTTALHFGLATAGLVIGYGRWPVLAWTVGAAYLAFALGQMYIIMPLRVCPSCVYRSLPGAWCVMGMNLVSARVVPPADPGEFHKRGVGFFCHNHLYMTALIAPLILLLPALAVRFSLVLLGVCLAVLALLAFRIFVVFPKVACGHCAAKGRCPNAKAMGLS